jgi:hypothetical protein
MLPPQAARGNGGATTAQLASPRITAKIRVKRRMGSCRYSRVDDGIVIELNNSEI